MRDAGGAAAGVSGRCTRDHGAVCAVAVPPESVADRRRARGRRPPTIERPDAARAACSPECRGQCPLDTTGRGPERRCLGAVHRPAESGATWVSARAAGIPGLGQVRASPACGAVGQPRERACRGRAGYPTASRHSSAVRFATTVAWCRCTPVARCRGGPWAGVPDYCRGHCADLQQRPDGGRKYPETNTPWYHCTTAAVNRCTASA
jgi:hypothetical protein